MKELLTRLNTLDRCQKIELEIADAISNPNHRRDKLIEVNAIYTKAERITMHLHSIKQLNQFDTRQVLSTARSAISDNLK